MQFQDQKPVGKDGLSQDVATRPETNELLSRSDGMVKAFFSSETSALYEKAIKTPVGMAHIGDDFFEKNWVAAVVSMAKELDILPSKDWAGDIGV